MVSPLKRAAPYGPRVPGMPPMKRPRMPYNSSLGMGAAGSASGAVNPASLDAVGRLCRVCATPNPVIFRLRDRTELVERLDSVLGLKIDLAEDKAAGFPGVVCRKCCNLVETFFHFQKSVTEGQAGLKTQVEEKKKRDEDRLVSAALRESEEEARLREEQVDEVESIGVDPLDESILPDSEERPDTKVGNIRIKQESLRSQRSEEAAASSSSTNTTAPMTTVFTDAVPNINIKLEPGLSMVKMKKERKEAAEDRDELVTPEPAGDDDAPATADSTVEITPCEKGEKEKEKEKEETSSVVGEMFSQLVGEVEKINEGVRDQVQEQVQEEEDLEGEVGFGLSIASAFGFGKMADEEIDENNEREAADAEKDDGNENTKEATKKADAKAEDSKGKADQEAGEPEKTKTNGEEEPEEASKQSDDWVPEDAMEEDMEEEEADFDADADFDTNGNAEEEVRALITVVCTTEKLSDKITTLVENMAVF